MLLTDKLSAIAAAIRAKTGKSAPMTLDEMPAEIAAIVSSNGAEAARITTGAFSVTEQTGEISVNHGLGTTPSVVVIWAECGWFPSLNELTIYATVMVSNDTNTYKYQISTRTNAGTLSAGAGQGTMDSEKATFKTQSNTWGFFQPEQLVDTEVWEPIVYRWIAAY